MIRSTPLRSAATASGLASRAAAVQANPPWWSRTRAAFAAAEEGRSRRAFSLPGPWRTSYPETVAACGRADTGAIVVGSRNVVQMRRHDTEQVARGDRDLLVETGADDATAGAGPPGTPPT